MTRKKHIPSRWLAYRNIGDPISGTRFVAFKVPLAERYFFRLKKVEQFGPVHLFEAYPDLGLVIDLTNTDRYYPRESFERKGIRHLKIACPGRVVPTERLVQTFCSVVHEFLRETATKGSLIGVHCTHGINRTGYMICSYMIRQMLMNPRDAIAAFEAARGHNIERKEYIDALLHLRLDGPISDRQRMLSNEWPEQSGPSSLVGTAGFGQGPPICIQWNARPEDSVDMRSSSHLPTGPSSSSWPPWDSVPGPEVNMWPTTSRSSDYPWPSIPAPIPFSIPGPSRRHRDFHATGYSALPRLNNAGMYGRTHLPHTLARPNTDLNSEPAHPSSAEYGASQTERPIDGFSPPGTSQHHRGPPVLGRCPQQQDAPTSSHLAPPQHRSRLSPPLSSSPHPSSAGRRPKQRRGECRPRHVRSRVACDGDRGRERGGGGDGREQRRRRRRKGDSERGRGESAFTAHRPRKKNSKHPFVPQKVGESEK